MRKKGETGKGRNALSGITAVITPMVYRPLSAWNCTSVSAFCPPMMVDATPEE